eukprot:3940774-Rhodomonas_salina.1
MRLRGLGSGVWGLGSRTQVLGPRVRPCGRRAHPDLIASRVLGPRSKGLGPRVRPGGWRGQTTGGGPAEASPSRSRTRSVRLVGPAQRV